MESIEEQDDIQSHKNKNEYILPNYSQINYYPEKYITIPYENISNQNQFQAIKKIFHIDNRSNTIPDCNSISNQQIIIPEETSFNNAIHKTKEINENNLLINNSLNKETISENNNNANKFQTGRWSQTEHQKFIEGILKYGNEWKNVQNIIKTRTSTQARSHAQKFFLRLKKTIPQESFNNQDIIFKYIIGSYDKADNDFKLSQEQKDKLMSVIKSNLRAEENNNNTNKSDKELLKNESALDELNEDEEEDNLGYNKQPENEILGLQKKMSCDLEGNKKRKITFCSRKRKSSNDMSFNSNYNKIFDIKKDINNKRSIDITNENNSILNTSQQIVDNEKNNINNTNNNKTKNIIFNPNPNFIVNKNFINNSFINKDIENNSQTDTENIKEKKTNIIIHNTIYNFFINDENSNKTETNRNNNRFNTNNKNKLNNYQNENPRTVIFKTAMKSQKSTSQNTNSNQNENEYTQTHYNINYILRNKNFFPENINNNYNQENIFNNSTNNNINNNINNNKNNEPEQCNPFDLNFVNISLNDKKIQEGYFNNNNNNNDYIERIQTLSDKEKGYTFINEQ